MRTPLTVGELRAELALYPDDVPVEVYVREQDGTDRVPPHLWNDVRLDVELTYA